MLYPVSPDDPTAVKKKSSKIVAKLFHCLQQSPRCFRELFIYASVKTLGPSCVHKWLLLKQYWHVARSCHLDHIISFSSNSLCTLYLLMERKINSLLMRLLYFCRMYDINNNISNIFYYFILYIINSISLDNSIWFNVVQLFFAFMVSPGTQWRRTQSVFFQPNHNKFIFPVESSSEEWFTYINSIDSYHHSHHS
jgi:hypothetical protein